jgi:hypothetical protein
MRLQSLVSAWNEFFFTKQSPVPIALFRILYGILVSATLILLRPDWLAWYGVRGWVSPATVSGLEPGLRLNVFHILPQTDGWIEALFWIALVSTVLLAIGFLTRFNSVLVFLCLTSIQQRNLYITNGGDTFLRLAGFFLMFAPAGAALSIDRLIRVWRGREPATVQPQSPWAQRMIQLQLSLMYIVTFWLKLKGAPWVQGTALFYVYRLDELRHFPLPGWWYHPLVLKLAGWSALVLEFSLGVLIWVKEFRYVVLACGVLFHLWLEYSINVPLFQWDVLSAYVLFVDDDHYRRAGRWIRQHLNRGRRLVRVEGERI